VTASIRPAKGQTAIPPLLGQCMIDFDDAQASLVFDGFVPRGGLDALYIAGTNGAIDCRGPDLNKHTLTLHTKRGVASPKLKGSWFKDGFHGTMAELLCAIEEKRTPYNNARDNLNSLALCFAAVASSDSGAPQVPGTIRRLPATRT
jgi:predicted dehydrogenase